jgi:hypothetical protein
MRVTWPCRGTVTIIVAKSLDKYYIAYTLDFNLRPFTKQPTGRAVGLRPTVLLLPLLMSLQQQGFDRFPVFAGAQFIVSPAMLDIDRRIEIGVRAVPTDHTAKRLLVGSIGSVYIITHIALLRGVGAPDPDCRSASFDGIPGYLLGYVCQVGGVQIGVHGTHLELHGGHGEVFIGKLAALVLLKALVDRPVDRLPHVAGEPLPALECRER